MKRIADSPSILFVCTANICRSPMAEAMMGVIAQEHDPAWRAWKIGSAGVRAMDGMPASLDAVETMRSRGIDISTHRSRATTSQLITEHKVIIVMEQRHKDLLQFQHKNAAGKIFTLGEIVESDQDVADPFGGSLQDYEMAARVLEKWLEEGYLRIHYLAQGGSRHYLHRINK